MILQLIKYQKTVARFLLLIFYCFFASNIYASANTGSYGDFSNGRIYNEAGSSNSSNRFSPEGNSKADHKHSNGNLKKPFHNNHTDIGGPSQPEMASFKSVNVNNMVDLFTGKFSYNIPLLDVDGYPVNIFYDGNTGMEQDASWVGFGWNINPGDINRNMRGVPDDFDGTDTLVEQQQIKPKKIVNLDLGAMVELCGIQPGLSLGLGSSIGVSFDNYFGPALSISQTHTASFTLAGNASSDKSLQLSIGVGTTLSSRTGFTVAPSVSLGVQGLNAGPIDGARVGLSTSYNSRVGVASLQLSGQPTFNAALGSIPGTFDKYSTTISFARPTYIPTLHMPVTNTSGSGEIQLGLALFGVSATIDQSVSFSEQQVAGPDVVQYKPLVGYLYYQNAVNNPNAVMDFTRLGDKEVTPSTPIIAAPQYAYDVFMIQGEGTGGCIRPYRNDLGYVRDNTTNSKDNSLAFGADVGVPGHYGADFTDTKTPTYVGGWNAGNKLHNISFTSADSSWENVYFRNPGENCVQDPAEYNRIGGTDLVRYVIDGQPNSPSIEPVLQHFNPLDGTPNNISTNTATTAASAVREKRTQVVDFLTAGQASVIGLDTTIKSYDNQTILDTANNLKYTSIPRVGGYRKAHHISQINVTETNGKRYVYGLPVYNIIQRDFTFSITPPADMDTDKVLVDTSFMKTSSSLVSSGSSVDGYVDIKQTPAYANSFLLTGLLSPDYVDVTGDGISDDDIGTAVKFNYTCMKTLHNWRTPLTPDGEANYNPGNRTASKDDKGNVSFGERESWYMHSIESKTMIAIFTLKNRSDGKGPVGQNGGINSNDTSMKCLDRIDLYSKADLKQNGLAGAKPIKTVHFCYSYTLCPGTPDNTVVNHGLKGGKLTLDSIYFTYNGLIRLNKDKYVFSYVDSAGNGNPNYIFGASDRWGNYKPATVNPGGMKNRDYPYSLQDSTQKTTIDQNASAWALKKILLPSGGQIEVNYESNDYAYVQNKQATDMMPIVGFGPDSNTPGNRLFDLPTPFTITEHDFVFVTVPVACSNSTDVFQKYLQGLTQLSFKIAVNMPGGVEYVRSYATITNGSYGVYSGDPTGKTIWIKLDRVDGVGALSLSAEEYLRQQLPGEAFPGYDVSNESSIEQIGNILVSFLYNLRNAFGSPVNYLRTEGKTMTANPDQSFVRLNDPDGFKYGGGRRVKSIKLKDNWQAMTGQYTSTYGQTYDYTTTEVSNNVTRNISSGVTTYEPSIGGEENPFQTILQVSDKLPLGPASYSSIEMPVLDAFFPSPSVGYSKVTVRSINTNRDTTMKSRSGIGKQMTEYYTSKDYPTYSINTSLDPFSDIEQHIASTTKFWSQYAYDYKALSQGFLVVNNDMNGKMKSQASYAENDDTTAVNYTENFYRNTGADGTNDKFSFVDNTQGGNITQGNMGIDVELMTDAREFSTTMTSRTIEAQTDMFPVFIPWFIPFIWPVHANSDNVYRAVTTTKVVSYHAVLDSVLVIDKGSQVSTKNLVYDAETGNIIVSRTNNEYNQPVYNTNYPAYWAYSGMGPAYKNIDAFYSGVNFYNGALINSFNQSIFESGDELYVTNQGSGTSGCTPASPTVTKLWVLDTTKNTSSLTNVTPHFVFIDSAGNPYTGNGVSFEIIRSGKRNMLNDQLATVTSLNSPIRVISGIQKLYIDNASKVINASASEYNEKWQVDNNEIQSYTATQIQQDQCTSITVLIPACPGNVLEQAINPYRKGILGNFKQFKNLVFYGDRTELNPSVLVNLPQNGFINNFQPYWSFNNSNNVIPNITNSNWVWNAQISKTNSQGLELETKNALGIYTAAQYGYNKDFPVAITNNAAVNEAGYTGFEDAVYNTSIGGEKISNCKPFFNLQSNARIVNTDTTNFTAHTGKYVVAIAPGANSANGTFVIASPPVNSFSFALGTDTLKQAVLNNTVGVNLDYANSSSQYDYLHNAFWPYFNSLLTDEVSYFTPTRPGGWDYTPAYVINNQSGEDGMQVSYEDADYQLAGGQAPVLPTESSNVGLSQYVTIPSAGNYTLHLEGQGTWNTNVYPEDYPALDTAYYLRAHLTLINVSNNSVVYTMNISTKAQNQQTLNNSVNIPCPGIYKLVFTDTTGTNNFQYYRHAYVSFLKYYISSLTTSEYKTINSQVVCINATPISGATNMLNPIFTVPQNKKMVLSAWVHETCDSTVSTGNSCAAVSYGHNKIQLNFQGASGNSTTTFTPSGPIIEGWQRYEGNFTAPAGDTSMVLDFVNTGTNMIYFDDIRIHPFNANMKSYVYDPTSLRLLSTLDENNYATFYEYDDEGTLVRTKAETMEGIKTINETRSAKQKNIINLQ